MKRNGKINMKQVLLLIVVVLVVGYELLFAGGEVADIAPEASEAWRREQIVEQSSENVEFLYTDESSAEESGFAEMSEAPSLEEYLTFRNESLWESHYEKHGIEMGFASMEEYLEAANLVLYNEDTLYKIEAEDGDGVYFLEKTGEFVVVSTDGYIRTYFIPDDGIDYFNRQ